MRNTFKKLELSDCILQNRRIDIWYYPLHTEYDDAHTILNAEELARAKRYYFARHQRRFTLARATLRLILARYVNADARELTFTYGKHGKPQLSTHSSLQFNLSHSGDYALLAIGKHYSLGIDLEFFSARPYVGIGRQLFSDRENAALAKAPSMIKPWTFFHIWSQKEAFIKASGLGLSYPTKQFDVSPYPTEIQKIDDSLHGQTWNMISFMPHIACNAALCYHPRVVDIRYIKLDCITPDILSTL